MAQKVAEPKLSVRGLPNEEELMKLAISGESILSFETEKLGRMSMKLLSAFRLGHDRMGARGKMVGTGKDAFLTIELKADQAVLEFPKSR